MPRELKTPIQRNRKAMIRGKKSLVLRRIAVDTQGLLHAIGLTTADVIDRKGALKAFKNHYETPCEVTSVLVDGAYSRQMFSDGTMEILSASVEVAKRNRSTYFCCDLSTLARQAHYKK